MRISRFSNMFSFVLRLSAALSLVSTSLLAGSIGVHLASASGGNIWTVNVLTDSGLTTCSANSGSGGPACQLRDAINKAASGDTIKFSVNGTVTLGSVLPAITKTLTIDGTGKSVIISGGNNYMIGQVSAGGNLSIKSLAIDGGVNDFGDGGAIDNSGTLNVTNSTFSGNSGYSQNGGAILNSGTLTVTTSTFSGNSDHVGGAIYNSGTLTISNSLFSGNLAGDGGAIYNSSGGTGTIMNSQ